MDVHLAIRTAHIVAAMVIGGGAMLLAILCWQPAEPRQLESILDVARQYEVVFWSAFGVLVGAGVGNLGAFGNGLAGPETEWGRTLTLKLVLVMVIAAMSVARTLLVATLDLAQAGRPLHALRVAYGGTIVLVVVVVGLAEVLANG